MFLWDRWLTVGLAHEVMGMDVLQDFSKVPTLMPKEGEVEADEDEEEKVGKKKMGGEPTGKDTLGDKAKLKAWLSS